MSSKEISNMTLLFIRACKTQTPVRNIVRVYRRYYYRDAVRIPYQDISIILLRIVDVHTSHMTSARWIAALNPADAWQYGMTSDPEQYDYFEHVTHVLISIIRQIPVSALPRYPTPSKVRRMLK